MTHEEATTQLVEGYVERRLTVAQIYPHEDNCGHCEYGRIMHEEGWTKLALSLPEAIASGDRTKIDAANARIEARWKQTKYSLFYEECVAAGLDWKAEFAKRGWEP